MKVIRYRDPNFTEQIQALVSASSLFDAGIEQRTREVIEAVRCHGDAALSDLTKRFDGVHLRPDQLAVTTAEYLTASIQAEPALRQAVALSSRNVEKFSRRSLRKNWTGRNAQGALVGEKFDPFQRVGIYIPGGTAPLVSTAIMTVVLARVAGCREILVCTPPGKDGAVNPALIYALNIAGASTIYRVGGAQAIAAMALGTSTIPRTQKIFGPGNAYVVAAKRLLFGHVAIDLLPGPSEVLILADETAKPEFVAADLLAQAEHGSGLERTWLITPSATLLQAVEKAIARQLPTLSRQEFIRRALDANCWLVQVKDLDEGVELANRIAPEHCEIMTRRPEKLAPRLVTSGAIFLGAYSPTVLGDYVAGPSHELPTGGAGLCFAGLTVDQFQRRTSVVAYDRAALAKSLGAVQTFAKVEGLDAHGRSAAIRFETARKKAGGAKSKKSVSKTK